MTAVKVRRSRRPNMRRAVILFPSGLTLFNLFWGVFAIITASRGDFYRAGVFVLLGGMCDALDGRVARAANAGSQFGEELDSLVDAISFGLAPAMIMYFAVLNRDDWQWVFVFLFAACAVMRLARFNIEQAGTAKTYFSGLPSPAAGCTLASYYWFSQSWLYHYGAIGNLPWQQLLRFLMAALAALMISPIPYPVFPRTGWRSMRALAGTVLLVTSLTLFLTNRLEYFFPLCLLYVAWGPVRWLLGGLFERRQPTIPYDLSEGEDEEEDEDFESEPGSSPAVDLRPSVRDARPPREDRPKRGRGREQTAPKPERADDRPPRSEREDRPQRTEAEKAARREKREKRDAREGRSERNAPAPRTDIAPIGLDTAPEEPAVITVVPPILAGEIADAVRVVASPPAAVGSDALPARKRKRRRRRGERKERGPEGAAPQGQDADTEDAGGTDVDNSFDDGPYAGGSRSDNVVASPVIPVAHFNTQAPPQPAVPQVAPPEHSTSPAAPAPSPSTEAHE